MDKTVDEINSRITKGENLTSLNINECQNIEINIDDIIDKKKFTILNIKNIVNNAKKDFVSNGKLKFTEYLKYYYTQFIMKNN